MNKISEILTRGVANVIPNKEALEKVLRTEKKLNVYLGIDPTATKIHLGHAVSLRKLQKFADLGHHVTFLIGDFTALIGDTSDKDTERPMLTAEEIKENFQTYKEQAQKVLDFSKIDARFNSEWLSKLTFTEIVKLTQSFSFGDFASRELIRKRLMEGKKVGLHEGLYPVMQGYDSYHLDTDVQIGGTDQTFNMQAGRTLQKDLRNKESFVITTEFLTGTDGRKMSKSWGNAIWLNDDPNNMYGKIMSIKDDLIVEYFTLATDIPMEEVEKVKQELESGTNPIELKKRLAYEIVRELNSQDEAQKAKIEFENVFQKGEDPMSIRVWPNTLSSGATIANALTASGTVSSQSEAKRLIEQGAVSIDDRTVTNPFEPFPSDEKEHKVKAGRKFVKIKK